MRPVGTAEELERRRRRAVEPVKQGEPPDKVASFLGCGRSSVYTWVKADREDTRELAARPHAGPKPRLSDDQIKESEGLLLEGAKARGWHNELWSAHRVAEMVRRHSGVECPTEHARELIRRRLRSSSREPQEEAKQRNEAKIAHRRGEELPRIIEQAEPRKARLVFPDESGFQLSPVVRRTYAPGGETPIVEAWRRKGPVSAISAVTVSPVRRRPNPYFRLPPDNADGHGEGTVASLAQSRGEVKGPMTILGDQSKIHGRSSVGKAGPSRHPEILTEGFPGYAPDADPDEGVWGWAKYHRLPNYAPGDTKGLRFRPWDELSALKGRPDLLASFIRHAEIPLRL